MAQRVEAGDVYYTGNVYVQAGGSVDNAIVGGVLFVNDTTYEPPPTGDPGTDLFTYNLLANSLNVNGQSLWFDWTCYIGATTSVPFIRVYFGTELWATFSFSPASTTGIQLRGRLFRTGAATQKCYATLMSSLAGGSVFWRVYNANLTQNLAADVAITFNMKAVSGTDQLRSHMAVLGIDGTNT